VTDARPALVDELVASGLERREARWLVEEFVPGGDEAARDALADAAKRRLAGEPLQYVVGHWPFRGLDLDLDARVLIPRPETEELVDVALAALARAAVSAPLILDLGCGSGAIGLALVGELDDRGVRATLVGVDRSRGALAVARRNAAKHHVTSASFVESSWFSDLDPSLTGRCDLVVANPPYVGAVEIAELDDVLSYEPREALVARDARGVSGFADVDHVLTHVRDWLVPGGSVVLEHGDMQGAAALEVASEAGLADAMDVADMAGRSRVLVARRP
jgi:release factor glutamine methyltransferase